MSFQPGDRYSAVAGADLSAKRYYLVKLNSSGEVVLASAATDAILGVLDNTPKSGGTAEVVLLNGPGSFKVKLAANTSKDAFLTSNASGLAVATTTANDRVIGQLVRTSVANEIAEYIKLNEKY